MAWRGQHRGTGSSGESQLEPDVGSGTGSGADGRNQEIPQKQIRKGLLGEGSKKGEPQVPTLGRCVKGPRLELCWRLGPVGS